MLTSGIYSIYNPHTNTIYIGQSVKTYTRINSHKRKLKQNKHTNDDMQKEYNLTKGRGWIFKTLLLCELEELRYFEQLLLNQALTKYPYVYNVIRNPFKDFEIYQQNRSLFYTETLGVEDPTLNRIQHLI